jgi:hypothetical protein
LYTEAFTGQLKVCLTSPSQGVIPWNQFVVFTFKEGNDTIHGRNSQENRGVGSKSRSRQSRGHSATIPFTGESRICLARHYNPADQQSFSRTSWCLSEMEGSVKPPRTILVREAGLSPTSLLWGGFQGSSLSTGGSIQHFVKCLLRGLIVRH